VAWYTVLLLLLGTLVLFMALGLPVVFAFFATNLLGAWFFMGGENGILQLMRNAVDSVESFALLPIPLFILMGEIMFHTGVAQRAIDAIDKLIARVPGRLSLVAIVGGTIFSALSGSTIANTAMLGSTLLPEMFRRGYKPSIAIGPIVAVGGLAMLIPPSALAVLLGSVAQIPIGALLIAAIIPALIMAVLFFGYVIVRCRLDPTLAPTYDVAHLSWRERLMPTVKYVLPLSGIFIVVVGSIIGGFATPTESAALGAAACLIAAAAYRKLDRRSFFVSLRESLRFTVMTLFIICGSITFSQIMAFSQASAGMSAAVLGTGLGPTGLLLAMIGILLFLGCFMDQVSMMMITVPLFMPIVQSLGFELVWFGVLMLMCLEIGLATPPFGLLLFVAKGASPQTPMREIVLSVAPFIGLALSVVVLLILVPELTLVLPRLMAAP
jgi:tripartite ATP-independent transporter DctM subunit